jgi:hypothetical protein
MEFPRNVKAGLRSGPGRREVSCRISRAIAIDRDAINLANGSVAGELMFDVAREFGKALEPLAEVCCSPFFVT